VGKSQQLHRRLYRHWATQDNQIDNYTQSILFGEDEYDIELGFIGSHHLGTLEPSCEIQVAIWLEPNERELMFLEHELIYKFRPILNKG
jgi:hypothetical protein